MPDTDAVMLRPLWGSVQRKPLIVGGGRESDSRSEKSEGMDAEGHGSLSGYEPRTHLRYWAGKTGSWLDYASDYRQWPRDHDVSDIEGPL